MRHPRDGGAIIKAQRQVQSHRDLATAPFDQTDDGRICLSDRHEIDQCNAAVGCLEHCLQHHRAFAVGAADAGGRIDGSDPPSPVLGCSKQGREASTAVEARPAQPIDGAVAAHESSGRAVADQRIIFDGQRQVGLHRRGDAAERQGSDVLACVLLGFRNRRPLVASIKRLQAHAR